MTQTWPKIFTDPAAAEQWLDETYTKLNSSTARESLVYAVGTVAKKHLSGDIRSAATSWLWRAQEKEPDTDYRCDQLITLYEMEEAKALEAIDGFYFGITSPMKRAELIRRITNFTHWQMKEAGQDGLIDWLWKVAGTDTSPYCRQECLSVLYTDLGQEKALEQYVRDTDQDGVMGLTQEDQVLLVGGLNWQFLKAAGQKYPQSYLGRGIKAYEAVRGIPYFEIDRIDEKQYQTTWGSSYLDGQYPPYGDEQYEPDREIPGWEKFLAEFPRHPASDDAAYRLARCYEIKGRFADAVQNNAESALFN